MSVSRAFSSGLSCHTCRIAAIRSFTPSSFSHVSTPSHSASWTAIVPSQTITRSLSSSRVQRSTKVDLPPPETDPGLAFLESENSTAVPQDVDVEASKTSPPTNVTPVEAEASSQSAQKQTSPVPWYLQTQHSRPPPTPEHIAREAIPDLPPNPPPLLKELLEYVSITAGLDDLELFDLRHLDPPPALGAKLLMIIGTARSEKHLHVSADRFCRHLRREYGLKANAAGLLGRNELKIKLRRKAKRMRLLANIGGQEPEGNMDDGIRTGWICVTLGKIEAHPADTEMPGLTDEDFVGFRDVKPGVNVVFQMFTEEKRAEIDLETLWGGVLRTHDRRDIEAEERVRAEGDFEELDETNAEVEESEEPADSRPVVSKPQSDLVSDASKWQFKPPTPSKGDVFPPAWLSGTSRRKPRRLHTVGLDSTV
jgi:ribosomal silencing factor RsfS